MTSAKPAQDTVRGGLFALTLFVWVLGLLPISGATQTGPERTRPWLQSLSCESNRVLLQTSSDLRLRFKLLEIAT